MARIRDKAQLTSLASLADAHWETEAGRLAALSKEDADLCKEFERVQRLPRHADFASHLAGLDKADARWRQRKLQEINEMRVQLKLRIEDQKQSLQVAFGRKQVLQKLVDRQAR